MTNEVYKSMLPLIILKARGRGIMVQLGDLMGFFYLYEAITSISTKESLGRRLTPTVVLAGR
jgi:hypothetical protein